MSGRAGTGHLGGRPEARDVHKIVRSREGGYGTRVAVEPGASLEALADISEIK